MANVTKFAHGAVVNQLRHVERTIEKNTNQDIDPNRAHLNYSLLPDRGCNSYTYYLQRKSKLYCYNRSDVKTMAGWVVTAPADLPRDEEQLFFKKTHEFLCNRYGMENAIASNVHYDEKGRPHIHFYFIPVVADKKHGGEKICANDRINRAELRDFHPKLQKFLDAAGLHCKVQTGITREIGGSISVADLKKAESYIQKQQQKHEYSMGGGGSQW